MPNLKQNGPTNIGNHPHKKQKRVGSNNLPPHPEGGYSQGGHMRSSPTRNLHAAQTSSPLLPRSINSGSSPVEQHLRSDSSNNSDWYTGESMGMSTPLTEDSDDV